MNISKKVSVIIFIVFTVIIVIAIIGAQIIDRSMTFKFRKSSNIASDYILTVYGQFGTEATSNTYLNGNLVASDTVSLSFFSAREFYFKTSHQPKNFSGKIMLDQKIILFSEAKNGREEFTELIVKKIDVNRLSPKDANKQKMIETELKALKEEKIQKEKDQAIKN